MSIEAISWALNQAPIPTDRRDASSLAMVLVGLANHADPDGRNAFPSNATLTRYTRLSERSVRNILRELTTLELIQPSDPGIVAAYISRADRRPNGYDLNLSLTSVDNSTQPVDNRYGELSDEGQSLPPNRP
ncbi:helix-turn-helix domain-containing protein [Streptomyces sp. MN03-5084-2B]|nr:helix-turn-helix domain-containing protein [Streptomyces sp. MN03-5084-2B]